MATVTDEPSMSINELVEMIDLEYEGRLEHIAHQPVSLPESLRRDDLRFCLVRSREKRAFEKGWQLTANYSWDSQTLMDHLNYGGNYGVIGGYGGLVVVDIDNGSFIDTLRDAFPKTFTVQTRKGVHLYFTITDRDGISSRAMSCQKSGERVGDIKGGSREGCKGRGYVVCPGSIHPEGILYDVIVEKEITSISKEEFTSILNENGITLGVLYNARRLNNGTLRVRDVRVVSEPRDPREGDPEYLKYLPHWYREAHRKRDSLILRGHEGRITHLRICATLKKWAGNRWREYCHDLTRWMFREEYNFERTEKEFDNVVEIYYFRQKVPPELETELNSFYEEIHSRL